MTTDLWRQRHGEKGSKRQHTHKPRAKKTKNRFSTEFSQFQSIYPEADVRDSDTDTHDGERKKDDRDGAREAPKGEEQIFFLRFFFFFIDFP